MAINFHSHFFDISKAFERAWYDGIIFRLHEADTHLYISHWIADFLSDRYFAVQVTDQMSARRHICAGVPQGSCISPTLFCLYISSIADDLIRKFPQLKVALYADDLCVWSTKRRKSELRIALQEAIDEIDSFCTEWCLDLCAAKSNYTIFTTAGFRNSYIRDFTRSRWP